MVIYSALLSSVVFRVDARFFDGKTVPPKTSLFLGNGGEGCALENFSEVSHLELLGQRE